MTGDRHHDSAICHLATMLVTRVAACVRNQQPYALRDVDGIPITEEQGREIVKQRYQIEPRRRDNLRHKRMRETAARRRRTRSRQAHLFDADLLDDLEEGRVQ